MRRPRLPSRGPPRRRRSTARTKARAPRRDRSIASAIARSPPPRCSTASRSAASTAIASTRSSPAPKGRRNERARLRPRRFFGAVGRRGRRRRRDSRRGAPPRPRHRRSCAPDRAASSGSSRSSRSRPPPAASAMVRSRRTRSARLFEAGFLAGGAASQGARPRRGHPLSRAAAAAHLRALRPDRSPLARRLSPSWRAAGPRARVAPRPQGDGRGGSGLGPARARRRGLSDRHQMAHDGRASRPIKNTSSATPTRATAALSPTGC